MQITTSSNSGEILGFDAPRVWDTNAAFKHLHALGNVDSKRTAERRLHELKLLPPELTPDSLQDELNRSANGVVLNWAIKKARSQRKLVLFAQLFPLPTNAACLHANDARGGRYWLPLEKLDNAPSLETVLRGLQQIQSHVGKDIAVFPHGQLVGLLRGAQAPEHITLYPSAYLPTLDLPASTVTRSTTTPLLSRLEAESIHIIREAVAEAENPVMLYSVGKDSSVMLHLARKAFYPSPPPFPLMHVDTRWKFQEMYLFREHMARVSGMDLIVHINPEAIAKDINPFDHGSALHTDITKTEGLKQALDKYKFDVVFGGARRDEEKSRAKERIFSFRSTTHRWDPKQQRPELWNLYNTKKNSGESIRVFPLSNWTELDIWQYIYQEDITVVPLYFSKKRPVVIRDGMLLMVDDGRFRLLPGEDILEKVVRFRTLGCYPLTGAIESMAAMGVEKVAVSAAAIANPAILGEMAAAVGRQSVVAVIDVRKRTGLFAKGYEVCTHNGKTVYKQDPVALAKQLQVAGAGEIVVNSIDRDGLMQGYDLELASQIKQALKVPVTFLGGAGSLDHLSELISKLGVVGAAAGSLFVFKGKYRAVLINYPNPEQKIKLCRETLKY